jgi:hypothetical protein
LWFSGREARAGLIREPVPPWEWRDKHDRPKESITHEELALSNTLEVGALIALLDRKGLRSKDEVLREIKNLQRQLAQRTGKLPEQQPPFPEPYLNGSRSRTRSWIALLELFNATKLTSHQAKLLLERVRVLIELGERAASKTSH